MTQGSDIAASLLYLGWTLESVPKTSILWVDKRKDMGPFLAGDPAIQETICIGCYDNRSPIKPTSFKGAWRHQSNVTIDIGVKITETRDDSAAETLRHSICDEVARIFKANNVTGGIPVWPDFEDTAETDLYYRKVMVYNIVTFSEVT